MKHFLILLMILFSLLIVGLGILIAFGASHNLNVKNHRKIIHYGKPFRKGIEADTLSILTYNIGYLSGMTNNLPVERPEALFEANLKAAQKLLMDVKPDLIGFQEIDFGSSRSMECNQLDSLSAGFAQAYRSINWDKTYVPFPYWPVRRHFGKMISGQAILSRFAITNEETFKLTMQASPFPFYNQFYLDRLVQVCDVTIGGHKVKLINLHLEAFDRETRVRQAQSIKGLIERYQAEMPLLVFGDFNSAPPYVKTDALDAMDIIMEAEGIKPAIDQATYESNPESCMTYSSDTPHIMIDYIFYNEQFIEKIEARVLKEAGQLSDHLPVLMRFRVKPHHHVQ